MCCINCIRYWTTDTLSDLTRSLIGEGAQKSLAASTPRACLCVRKYNKCRWHQMVYKRWVELLSSISCWYQLMPRGIRKCFNYQEHCLLVWGGVTGRAVFDRRPCSLVPLSSTLCLHFLKNMLTADWEWSRTCLIHILPQQHAVLACQKLTFSIVYCMFFAGGISRICEKIGSE